MSEEKPRSLLERAWGKFERSTYNRGLQLISLHVPKTAGTSFRSTLDAEYYGLIYFDYHDQFNPDMKKYKAVHGHIRAHMYHELYPQAKMITWLRDPVERVISYYYFWLKEPRHNNTAHDHLLDNNLTLVEFAETDFMRNELLGYYMKNLSPAQFHFIGIVERYDEDVKKLAAMLGWKTAVTYKHNASPGKREVSAAERSKIKELMKDEVEVYEYAKRK